MHPCANTSASGTPTVQRGATCASRRVRKGWPRPPVVRLELFHFQLHVRAGPAGFELLADSLSVEVAASGLEGFHQAEERAGIVRRVHQVVVEDLLGGGGVARAEEVAA